jgi:hypothetical protein
VTNTVEETVNVSAVVNGSQASVPASKPLEFKASSVASVTWIVTRSATNATPGRVLDNGVESWTAVVHAADGGGLPVAGQTVQFTVPPAVSISAGPYVTNAAGDVTVQFTSTTVGSFEVRARVGAIYATPNPATISFDNGPVSGPASSLTAPGGTAEANGTATQVVTANVRDASNQPIAGASVVFAVPADTQVVGSATGTTNAAGQATLTLVSTKAGVYDVTATANGVAIVTGSPAKVTFTAGAFSPTKSRIYKVETGPMTANGVQVYTVKAELRDANDNVVKVAGSNVQFAFTLSGQPVEYRNASTNDDGVATVTFATTKAGTWQATAKFNTYTVETGSPVGLLFNPGPVDLTKSTLWVSPDQARANGTSFNWAKAVLRDVNDNVIHNQTVNFTVSQGSAQVDGPWFGTTKTLTSVAVAVCDITDPVGTRPVWCDQDGLADRKSVV